MGCASSTFCSTSAVVAPEKARRPGEELVHHQPDGVDVAAGVHVRALELLRRHVGGRADQRRRVDLAGFAVRDPGDAEIEHLHEPAPRHHQVCRLDVPVDDASLMREAETVGHFVDDVELADRRKRRIVSDQRRERVAIDVLHGDIELTVVVADVVDGDDVGVLEPAGRLSFTHEATAQVLAIDAQEFQRHVAVEHGVAGEVQHPHAPFPEESLDVVPPDARGDVVHGGS